MAKQQIIFIIEDESAIHEVVRKYLDLGRFDALEAEFRKAHLPLPPVLNQS